MGRGVRLLYVLAAFALAGAQQPRAQSEQPKAGTQQSQPSPAPPPAIKTLEPGQATELYRPCEEGEDSRNSDLCAQWKAADAARDAANWTYWGIILGILGTVGLFWTLFYTRAAVKAAQSATKDADEALAIARRNAKAATDLAKHSERASRIQLRAYLAVLSVEVDEPHLEEEGRFSKVHIKLVNNGQTPATVTRFYVQFDWSAGGMFTPLLVAEKATKFRVHKGKDPVNMPLPMRAFGDGLAEAGQLVAVVSVDYVDVFDKEYNEIFCFQLGDGQGRFNQLDLPHIMNHFPLPDYLDHCGLDAEGNPKEEAKAKPKRKRKKADQDTASG